MCVCVCVGGGGGLLIIWQTNRMEAIHGQNLVKGRWWQNGKWVEGIVGQKKRKGGRMASG